MIWTLQISLKTLFQESKKEYFGQFVQRSDWILCIQLELYLCKHSNCLGFAGTVLVFGMLSRCPRLNQFVLVFRFLTKKLIIFTQLFISSVKTYTNKCFSLFDSIIYSNSHREHYKKHNSVELNKNVILKTFHLNVRVLFRETYI